MLKNKLKLIVSILAIIAMLFTYSVCLAVDGESDTTVSEEAVTTEATNTTSEEATTDESTAENANQNTDIVESDLYLMEPGSVTVDYVVDGNAFIIADTVTITSQIGGDAYIMANTINIEGGYVYSNLFAIGNNININGIVYDLYSMANSITVGDNGYIYRDVHAFTNDLNIFGAVGRNVATTCNNISFTSATDESSTGTIYGNLNYTAENEIAIDESYVEGDITFNQSTPTTNQNTIESYLYSLAIYVIMALAIYLLVIWLAPKFTNGSREVLAKKPLPVIGFGLLGLFIIPVVILLFMILQVTIKVSFALLALYILLLFMASSIFILAVSESIANKINMQNKWQKLGMIILVAVVLWAIELIPYVGDFVIFASCVLGIGILITYILPKKSDKKEQEEVKSETEQ